MYRFEAFRNRPSLRYATARLSAERLRWLPQQRPEQRKQDWKVGEVGGVLGIIRPLDRDASTARARGFVGRSC